MKVTAAVLLCFVLGGCGSEVEVEGTGGGSSGTGSSTSTTSTTSTSSECPGEPFYCAAGCGSDYFPEEAGCVEGAWVCPPGTVNPADCPPGTCWGLPLPCEVCGPGGWSCEPEPGCLAGCGSGGNMLACAVCPADPGPVIFGVCACQCDEHGQYTCGLAPGCCEQDMDCGDRQYVPCVNNVCKQPVAGKCWSDAECAPGSACVGAQVCPCGAECDAEDQPGDCVVMP